MSPEALISRVFDLLALRLKWRSVPAILSVKARSLIALRNQYYGVTVEVLVPAGPNLVGVLYLESDAPVGGTLERVRAVVALMRTQMFHIATVGATATPWAEIERMRYEDQAVKVLCPPELREKVRQLVKM